MGSLRRFVRRLVNALWPGRAETDLAREISAHLMLLEDEFRNRGMQQEDARLAAKRAFAGVERTKERHRDARSFAWLDDLRRDCQHAMRLVRRDPVFAVTVILSLGIGIGGNTAIFSLVDAVRSGALPYQDADRLVQLSGTVVRSRVERRGASYPDYLDWRAQAKSVVDIAAFDPQKMTLAGTGDPERIDTEFVSAPYFSLLGVTPAKGRTFRADEDLVSDPAAVVVMSDALWKRQFGADPRVVGRTISLNGGPFKTYTVIGLMPPGFTGLTDTAELWLPFALWAPPSVMTDRRQRAFVAVARLKPGVTLAAAQSELDGISRRLEQAYPESNVKRGVEVTPLDAELFGRMRSVF